MAELDVLLFVEKKTPIMLLKYIILHRYISNNSNDLIGSIFAAAELCIMLLVAAMTNHISNSNEFSWASFDHTN